MSEFGPGPEFLKEKYDLHNSPEVESAANRTEHRTGGAMSNDAESKIQNYIDRIKEVTERENPGERERLLGTLKNIVLDKFVTKPEEVSQNYELFLQEVIEERGMRGDWDSASDEQKQAMMTEQIQAVLEDQEGSLEIWIDYLSSSDAMYPDWLKYWAFRSILGLSEYNKEQKKFPKRSKGTVKMFPDLNYEALAYTVDAVSEKFEGKSHDFPYDIQEDEKARFFQFLNNENFSNLYAWAIENINPIDEELLKTTEGRWIKYDQGPDHQPLVQSIRGKGTGWCTAGKTTAKNQLKTGDFYVFYSSDQEDSPTIPRIAIRMENDKIAEVRGIAYKQNLDPFAGEILTEKLQEFPDKDEYLKKEHDMARLTDIKNKSKEGIELNKADLVFLYEVDSKIQGFGYKDDPRIKELRNGRDIEADLLIIFECDPSQISGNSEQVNENTKAYIGEWNIEVFQKIKNYPRIEHFYESFPDKKIFMQSLETDSNINSAEMAEQALIDKNDYLSDWGKDILYKIEFSKESQKYDLVRFDVEQLGFPNGATAEEIYKRAGELGLELCPAEVGPHLRLQYRGNEWMLIAMKQIADRNGYPNVFYLDTDGAQLELHGSHANPSRRWDAAYSFVFRFRKDSQES